MLPVLCDLCGKVTRDANAPFKHGALSLCEQCARLFGKDSPARAMEEPGSLAAVEVAQNAEEGPDEAPETRRLGTTPSIASKALPPTPTLRIPAGLLNVLVRDLDGPFRRVSAKKASTPPTARPEPTAPVDEERRPTSKRARVAVSVWSRGIMASTGVTLAVMLAFASSRSSAPKAASVPTALASEAPVANAPPAASTVSVSPIFTRPSVPGPASVSSPLAQPAAAPQSAPPAAGRRAPPRPKPVPSATPALEPARTDVTEETEPRDTNTTGPVPEFGGRD
jgi:hypothetical protein